ncbi:hypothetical protein SAMN04489720_2519 [Agrococcus jejuensis]|uniref:Uncharacterized protein n=2 Tax=Agrococcus jejuensis TaxID=399736 RepID=A0A1G8FKL5_9MICO|nr:hypothetical protein SAMN04489720_2519 [Agrococcus jejuensis]
MTPALAVAVGVGALTRGALVVVGLWLLVGVFIMVGVEEIVGTLPGPVDVASRATIAGLGALVVVGGVGEPLRLSLERGLRMRSARRLAAAGAPMPPAAERAQLVRGAMGPLRVVLGIVGGTCLLIAPLLLAFADDETSIRIAGVVLLVAGLLLVPSAIWLLAPASRRWREHMAELERAWPRFHRTDRPIGVRMARERRAQVGAARAAGSSVPRQRRTLAQRLDAALYAGLGVAFAIVLIGLFLRQQCRRCEPVSYDPWGERLVDGVATVGLVLFAGTVALLMLRGLASIVEHAVREVLAARAADRGTLRRSAWLDGAVGSASSLELVALVVGVVGMAVAGLVVASGIDPEVMSEREDQLVIVRGWAALAPAAAVLLGAAAMLGIAGAVVTRAWRAVVWPHLGADPFAGRLDGASGSGSGNDADAGGSLDRGGDGDGGGGGDS